MSSLFVAAAMSSHLFFAQSLLPDDPIEDKYYSNIINTVTTVIIMIMRLELI